MFEYIKKRGKKVFYRTESIISNIFESTERIPKISEDSSYCLWVLGSWVILRSMIGSWTWKRGSGCTGVHRFGDYKEVSTYLSYTSYPFNLERVFVPFVYVFLAWPLFLYLQKRSVPWHLLDALYTVVISAR